VLLIVVAVLAAVSCATSAPSEPNASVASGRNGSAEAAPPTVALAGFRSVSVTVVAANGTTHELCLLLADTDDLREQGLMYVEDVKLGGHAGMMFVFQNDVNGSFWMRNTRLPLSIAYVAANGTMVSSTDMAPCPDGETCPTYPSGGPYRYAIEVPQGRLESLGISAGSRVTVSEKSCVGTS
jgi:uncharacterized membrane protein (UPF0127 family)